MDKAATYQSLLKEIDTLYDKELTANTNLLNMLAILREKLDLFWIGLYYTKPDKLVLGPYQGLLPCTKIPHGKGLCGQTATKQQTHYVNDVSCLENYIACHPETQAEIVVPGFKRQRVHFVLDVDSTVTDAFDETDRQYLEQIAEKMAGIDEQP